MKNKLPGKFSELFFFRRTQIWQNSDDSAFFSRTFFNGFLKNCRISISYSHVLYSQENADSTFFHSHALHSIFNNCWFNIFHSRVLPSILNKLLIRRFLFACPSLYFQQIADSTFLIACSPSHFDTLLAKFHSDLRVPLL